MNLWWCWILVGAWAVPMAVRAAEAVPVEQAAEDVEARVGWLQAELARHDDLYFRQAAPEISDHAYDRLKAELRRLEAAYPQLGYRDMSAVGDDRVEGWAKARHRVAMGSLDKVFTAEELAAWHERVAAGLGTADLAYAVEAKFDGVAISVTYEKGEFRRAVTRGNGIEGDEVSENVRVIPGVAATWAGGPEVVELRGEIYLPGAAFAAANAAQVAAGEEVFANPRNLAAGTLKQRDPEIVRGRGLRVVFFGWGAWEPAGDAPASLAEFRARLRAAGLPVGEEARHVVGLAALQQAVEEMGARRDVWPYATDGVVVKLARVADQVAVGEGAVAPRWAVAYKFAPDRATTRLTGITWQVGRTGVVTPVAEFEAVELSGSTVGRATLHHAARVEELGLRVGDAVVVEKAGEIIPAVVAVDGLGRTEGAAAYAVPVACPACGEELARQGVELVCASAACPAQVERRLVHFASRAGMDIGGLGPAMAKALVEAGWVASPVDLYRLERETLMALPGVGEVTADRLLAEIAGSRDRELSRVIVALGVPGVGPTGARALAERYGSARALVAATAMDATRDAGQARALAAWVAEPRYLQALQQLIDVGVTAGKAPPVPGSLSGEVVVFTGALAGWTRAEATAAVEAAGGEVAAEVSARTTMVVAGANAGATLAQAKARGVTIIGEAEFAARLEPSVGGGGGPVATEEERAR